MKTGLIESWANDPTQVGPLYPFPGFEVLMFVIVCTIFLTYIIWGMHHEEKEIANTLKKLLK